MNRRELLYLPIAMLPACTEAPRAFVPVEEASIDELRRYSSVELCKAYLDRIERIDGMLHSVIEINPDALDIAAGLDSAAKKGPLHGIPILIKDNIDTADRMRTTAGSLALNTCVVVASPKFCSSSSSSRYKSCRSGESQAWCEYPGFGYVTCPKLTGAISGVMNSAGNCAGIFGPMTAGYIVAATGDWTTPFLVAAGFALLSFIVFYFFVVPEPIEVTSTLPKTSTQEARA